jgi:hypothetical protein
MESGAELQMFEVSLDKSGVASVSKVNRYLRHPDLQPIVVSDSGIFRPSFVILETRLESLVIMIHKATKQLPLCSMRLDPFPRVLPTWKLDYG